MSEKRFELYSDDYFFGAYDTVTQEKINVLKSIDLLNSLVEENEQLRQTNEKLRWDLEKTRKDLDFFANLKVTAMKGCEPMDETTNLEHQTWTGGKR